MAMKEITKEELRDKLENKEVVILNVLNREDYDRLHIKDSLSAPLEELESHLWEKLDKSTRYVTHCSDLKCTACVKAASFLEGKGFDVNVYRGGIKEWAESGYATEGTMNYLQYQNALRI